MPFLKQRFLISASLQGAEHRGSTAYISPCITSILSSAVPAWTASETNVLLQKWQGDADFLFNYVLVIFEMLKCGPLISPF